MKPQMITTEGGEELVILTRRDYDVLLARLGDEEAEDRATLHFVHDARVRIASGAERLVKAAPDGRPPRLLPTLGQRIRSLRKSKAISQVELAVMAEIGQGYLSNIENDAKVPSRDVLERLAETLGVQADTL